MAKVEACMLAEAIVKIVKVQAAFDAAEAEGDATQMMIQNEVFEIAAQELWDLLPCPERRVYYAV